MDDDIIKIEVGKLCSGVGDTIYKRSFPGRHSLTVTSSTATVRTRQRLFYFFLTALTVLHLLNLNNNFEKWVDVELYLYFNCCINK